MTFIAITRCLKTNRNGQEIISTFHFKGFYMGTFIRSIKVATSNDVFFRDKDYILVLDSIKIKSGELYCRLFNFKKLF